MLSFVIINQFLCVSFLKFPFWLCGLDVGIVNVQPDYMVLRKMKIVNAKVVFRNELIALLEI